MPFFLLWAWLAALGSMVGSAASTVGSAAASAGSAVASGAQAVGGVISQAAQAGVNAVGGGGGGGGVVGATGGGGGSGAAAAGAATPKPMPAISTGAPTVPSQVSVPSPTTSPTPVTGYGAQASQPWWRTALDYGRRGLQEFGEMRQKGLPRYAYDQFAQGTPADYSQYIEKGMSALNTGGGGAGTQGQTTGPIGAGQDMPTDMMGEIQGLQPHEQSKKAAQEGYARRRAAGTGELPLPPGYVMPEGPGMEMWMERLREMRGRR